MTKEYTSRGNITYFCEMSMHQACLQISCFPCKAKEGDVIAKSTCSEIAKPNKIMNSPE